MTLSILIILIINAFLIGWLIDSFKKNRFVGMLAGMLVCMIIVYGLIPVLLLALEKIIRANIYIYGFDDLVYFVYDSTGKLNFIGFFVNLSIGIIALWLGYDATRWKNIKYSSAFENIKAKNLIYKISIFAFIIGGISLAIYIYALDGLSSAIRLGNKLRGFSSEVQVDSILTLFKVPATIIQVAFYLSAMLYVSKENKQNSNKVIMIVSFLMAGVYNLINAGKTNIMILILFVIFLFFRSRRDNPWPILMIILLISLPLLGFFDFVFDYLSFGDESGVSPDLPLDVSLLKYLREFSYPFQIELHIDNIADKYGFMYFKNSLTDILSFMPGLSFQSSFENTSEYFVGSYWRFVSGIPNDIISYGYLNLSYLGTFIHLYLWGRISGYVDKWIATGPVHIFIRESIGFIVAFKAFSHVLSSDWSSILIDLTYLFIFYLIYQTSSKSNHYKLIKT